MTINNKAQVIEIDGKEYINISLFTDRFFFGSASYVRYLTKIGLPHIRKNSRYWFNEDLCHKWFAGVI